MREINYSILLQLVDCRILLASRQRGIGKTPLQKTTSSHFLLKDSRPLFLMVSLFQNISGEPVKIYLLVARARPALALSQNSTTTNTQGREKDRQSLQRTDNYTSGACEVGERRMVTRKKSGAPDSKHFEAPETAAKFEPVKQWLLKNCRKVRSSCRLSTRKGKERLTLRGTRKNCAG